MVTGGAGFIGSHLAAALLRARFQVTVIDDLSRGRRSYVPKPARLVKLDIRSDKLQPLLKSLKPAYLCHLAAQVSEPASRADAAADAAVNIVGSLNLMEAVKNLRLKKFLFVSTAALYSQAKIWPTPESAPLQPVSPYGLAKFTVEQYLNYYALNFGLPYVVVRPANVYGPRQQADADGGVVAIFCQAVLRRAPVIIEGSGQQTRDFIYVTDVAQGIVAALRQGQGVYNLATGEEVSIRQLILHLTTLIGQVPAVKYGPARPNDITRSCLDNKKASRDLNWQAVVPLLDGLRQTLHWYKTNS